MSVLIDVWRLFSLSLSSGIKIAGAIYDTSLYGTGMSSTNMREKSVIAFWQTLQQFTFPGAGIFLNALRSIALRHWDLFAAYKLIKGEMDKCRPLRQPGYMNRMASLGWPSLPETKTILTHYQLKWLQKVVLLRFLFPGKVSLLNSSKNLFFWRVNFCIVSTGGPPPDLIPPQGPSNPPG